MLKYVLMVIAVFATVAVYADPPNHEFCEYTEQLQLVSLNEQAPAPMVTVTPSPSSPVQVYQGHSGYANCSGSSCSGYASHSSRYSSCSGSSGCSGYGRRVGLFGRLRWRR